MTSRPPSPHGSTDSAFITTAASERPARRGAIEPRVESLAEEHRRAECAAPSTARAPRRTRPHPSCAERRRRSIALDAATPRLAATSSARSGERLPSTSQTQLGLELRGELAPRVRAAPRVPAGSPSALDPPQLHTTTLTGARRRRAGARSAGRRARRGAAALDELAVSLHLGHELPDQRHGRSEVGFRERQLRRASRTRGFTRRAASLRAGRRVARRAELVADRDDRRAARPRRSRRRRASRA